MDALVFEDFDFSYADCAGKALRDVSICVPQGAFCLVVGASGSGKTTLLRVIKREITPAGEQSGTIEVFGERVEELDRVPECGFVFQDPDAQIVCDTVWRELAFGLENMGVSDQVMRRRIAELATYFGIAPWFDRRCSTLSGGQKQILNMASVIAMHPRMMLLDEPTSQLDPISTQRFVDLLSKINRELGITLVVATHSPEKFEGVADFAILMDGGEASFVDIGGISGRHGRAPARYSPEGVGNKRVVAVSNAYFAYGRELPQVLKGASIEAFPGEVLSLVGSNGCGKTTLLKVMANVLKPQSGMVSNSLIGSQAYLPQDPKLLFVCDTVLDELREWQSEAGYTDDDVAGACMRFGFEGLLQSNPLDLSGGQQQRLALAKLLLCKPRLLLLDEPTKGMDSDAQMLLADILRECAAEGMCAVIATHNLSFASRVSSRIALVFDGGIACCQPAMEFCEGNMFYVPEVNDFTIAWDGHGKA